MAKLIRTASLIASLVTLAFATLQCEAQSLTLLRQFQTFQGNLQFLPGGRILVKQNGQESNYIYRNGDFTRSATPLPAELQRWTAFDWNGVDYLNQVDQKSYDPEINHFLPSDKKVKKVLDVPESEGNKSFVLVCYTEKSSSEDSEPGDTDIFATGLERTQNKNKSFTYRRLWTKRLETDMNYGNFVYEDVPGMARFVLLYSLSLGGSGYSLALDVYRIGE